MLQLMKKIATYGIWVHWKRSFDFFKNSNIVKVCLCFWCSATLTWTFSLDCLSTVELNNLISKLSGTQLTLSDGSPSSMKILSLYYFLSLIGIIESLLKFSWWDGCSLNITLKLLILRAWRKKLEVPEQLENQSWTRGLWRMSMMEEMAEFVMLWDKVQDVQLNDGEDNITWKLTTDGQYTAKSAYEFQFRGSYSSFEPKWIWTAHAEPKHRFFTWLLVQEKNSYDG